MLIFASTILSFQVYNIIGTDSIAQEGTQFLSHCLTKTFPNYLLGTPCSHTRGSIIDSLLIGVRFEWVLEGVTSSVCSFLSLQMQMSVIFC